MKPNRGWVSHFRNGTVGVAIAAMTLASFAPCATAQAPASSAAPERETAQGLSRTFEDLAKRVSPAVVKVIVSGYGAVGEGDSSESSAVGRARGIGAGIIVDPDSYIITNYHVVKGADRVRVQITPAPVGDSQAHSQLTARGRQVHSRRRVRLQRRIRERMLGQPMAKRLIRTEPKQPNARFRHGRKSMMTEQS